MSQQDNDETHFVLDTSVVICLLNCGFEEEILSPFHDRVLIPEQVIQEIGTARQTNRPEPNMLASFIDRKLLVPIKLAGEGMEHFLDLTMAPGTNSIGDGEASTIANAVHLGGLAFIDDRKAIRVCRQKHPSLEIQTTVDLFYRAERGGFLSIPDLSNALYNALTRAHMSVLSHQIDSVVELLGPSRVRDCVSLPRSVRSGQ